MTDTLPQPPPPPIARKSGLGCFGCGCLVIVLIGALLLGIVGVVGYVGYTDYKFLTTTTASTVPSFDGGDEMYNAARQKIMGMDHNIHSHLPATVHLSANEINTLIARDPDLAAKKILLFVSLNADQARIQSSVPTENANPWLKGRFFNTDVTTGIHFNVEDREIVLQIQGLKFGNFEAPEEKLPLIQSDVVNPALTAILQANPTTKSFLEQTKTFEVENSELVIEIQ